MFQLNGNYEVDRRILKFDNLNYSTAATSTINNPNSQIYINMPRKNSVNSLLKCFFDLNFEVITKTDKSRSSNGDSIRLVNLGLIALLPNFILRTSNGKTLRRY